MFNFLKKKLNDLFKKTSVEIEKSEEEKLLKEKEKKEERKLGEVISKDIEKEIGERKKREIEKRLNELEEKEKAEIVEEKKEGFFARIKKGFTSMKLSENAFDEFFNELELILIENNVAIEAINSLRNRLKKELVGKEIKKHEAEEEIKLSLKEAISSLLIEPFNLEEKIYEKIEQPEKKPYVIVFFGINGSGKTTTIARLAYLLRKKFSVVLAAADTFRAASIEQLEKHAQNIKIEIIKSKYGADPASVAFDAIAHAKANNIDVVLIDTAGRMHTKTDLLREMEKIIRVSKPDLKIFVAESTTGNDAIEQAKTFNESVGIDALILTKSDIDERGGAMISSSYITGKPILFLGIGQEYKDLEIFDKKKILDKLFS